jgi:hypothetical protein
MEQICNEIVRKYYFEKFLESCLIKKQYYFYINDLRVIETVFDGIDLKSLKFQE